MDLSIVIVNWNTKDLLKKCLESVLAETKGLDFEVFVVDNGSKDGSCKMVEKNFPQVKLIENKQNVGFARANNQAIKKSRGEYILLLNPDTVILGNTLKKMVDFLENHHEVGILGPKILNPDGSSQPSCRTFPTLASQVLILLKLHNFFPDLPTIKKYYMLNWNYNKTREVDQVMGSCFMIRKKLINKIGPLDENYWILFEEVDFCKRAKLANWKTYFMPNVCIIHHKARAFEQISPIKKQIRMSNSMLRYFRKFHTKIAYFTILSLYPASLFLASLVPLILKVRLTQKRKEL